MESSCVLELTRRSQANITVVVRTCHALSEAHLQDLHSV